MALPYIDVASPILNAYFAGKQSRLQREKFTAEQEQQKIKNEQWEKAQKLQMDQWNEHMKLLQEQEQHAQERHIADQLQRKAELTEKEAEFKHHKALQRLTAQSAILDSIARTGVKPGGQVANPLQGKSIFAGGPATVTGDFTDPETGVTITGQQQDTAAENLTRSEQLLKQLENQRLIRESADRNSMARTIQQGQDATARAQIGANATIMAALLRNQGRGGGLFGGEGEGESNEDILNSIKNQALEGTLTVETLKKQYPKQAERINQWLVGQKVKVLTNRQASDLQDFEKAHSLISEFSNLYKNGSFLDAAIPGSDFNEKEKALLGSFAGLRNTLGSKNFGVLSRPEFENLKGVLPKAYNYLKPGQVDTKLKNLNKLLQVSADAAFEGMTPAQRAYHANRFPGVH